MKSVQSSRSTSLLLESSEIYIILSHEHFIVCEDTIGCSALPPPRPAPARNIVSGYHH